MSASYKCLNCGLAASEGEVGSSDNVVPCPKCGRDMYRSESTALARGAPGAVGRYGAGGPGGGAGRSMPAIPSRYASGGAEAGFGQVVDDEDDNPILVPRTPFVVILGLIFSFLPLACFAGLAISFVGLKLVNESPKGIKGREMAIAGIIISSLMSILTVVLMINARSR